MCVFVSANKLGFFVQWYKDWLCFSFFAGNIGFKNTTQENQN